MLQVMCRCGREMQLVHPPESGVVICSGCLTEVSVPGKLARRRVRDPVPRNEEWLTCRKCRNSFPWPTRYVGRMTRCPVCGKQVRMPNFRRKFNWHDSWNPSGLGESPDEVEANIRNNMAEWSRLYPGFYKNILGLVVLAAICAFLIFFIGLKFS